MAKKIHKSPSPGSENKAVGNRVKLKGVWRQEKGGLSKIPRSGHPPGKKAKKEALA